MPRKLIRIVFWPGSAQAKHGPGSKARARAPYGLSLAFSPPGFLVPLSKGFVGNLFRKPFASNNREPHSKRVS